MPDINRAYSWAIQTCNAPNVGYSQAYRNARTVGGITYYDCSSFINYALLAGGFSTPGYAPSGNAFTTYTEAAELLRLGFVEVPSNGEYLPGDIGLKDGHTEMCYRGGVGSGVFMGAHTSNAALANQVSIGSSGGDPNYARSFPRLFRWGSGGATGYGCSPYVVAALAGNAWQESHINPECVNRGSGAYGIFQWLGSRKDNLFSWCANNGFAPTDPIGQLDFLVAEDDWMYSYGGISSLQEFLTSTSTDVATLTVAFSYCWERATNPNDPERISFAMDALDYIISHAQDTGITTWETVPTHYLSYQQALNNSVLMYRHMSAGGGGGGIPGKKKRRMPAWMKIRYLL